MKPRVPGPGPTLVLGLTVALAFGAPPAPVRALGAWEEPNQGLVRTWDLPALTSLEIRGKIEFVVKPGPRVRVTVTADRALFSQMEVSQWWGAGLVSVESGLQGPREPGTVKAVIEVPSLEVLTVSGRSVGTVDWPGEGGLLRVWEQSAVEARVEARSFRLETGWKTAVILKGRVGALEVRARQEAQIDARALVAGRVGLDLDDASQYDAGPSGQASGLLRHQSVLRAPAEALWDPLDLREGALRRDATPGP